MYAIFEDGSHQFRVREGDRIVVDRREGEPGDELVFPKVLLLAGAGEPTIGAPDASMLSGGTSDGMGLLVVVTGSSSSTAAAQVRAAASQDETMVVVCATEYDASSRFVVDATSIESMIASWSVLILGAGQAVPT